MLFTRAVRRLLIAASLVACLLGGFAAYVAYLDEAEAQFHGGVLEEDEAKAVFRLIWTPIGAFAKWGAGGTLIAGIVPIAIWRVLARKGRRR